MPQSKIIMYSANWCGDCRRSKRLMDELNVAYTIIDIENDRCICPFVFIFKKLISLSVISQTIFCAAINSVIFCFE